MEIFLLQPLFLLPPLLRYDKVVEVKRDTSGIIVLLDGGNGMFGISCSLQKTDAEVKKIEKDKEVTVRGICTGMLMDVVLTRCAIVQPDKNKF